MGLAQAFGAEPLKTGETPPDWLRKPSPSDLVAVWPTDAFKKRKGGKAVVGCKVSERGVLLDCVVIDESPAGSGFGKAAIALTPQLLFKPAMKDGVPVESGVRFPVNFEWSGAVGGGAYGSRTHISNVTWNEAPSLADVAAAYPPAAQATKTAGQATLDCRMKGGGLTGCRVLFERPKGMGFGAAARKLAPLFRGPAAVGEQSTDGMKLQVPFGFTPEVLEAKGPSVGKPTWTGIPDDKAFQAAYPAAALTAGVRTGRARLDCVVAAGGAVDQCKVVAEDPAGLGFGAAAMSLAPSFRLAIWTDDGLPTVGGRVTIPLRYEFADNVEQTSIRVQEPAR